MTPLMGNVTTPTMPRPTPYIHTYVQATALTGNVTALTVTSLTGDVTALTGDVTALTVTALTGDVTSLTGDVTA